VNTETLESYTYKLTNSLGIRPCVPKDRLRELYDKKDFIVMMRYIQKTMELEDLEVLIELVDGSDDSDPDPAVAQIFYARYLPPYGSREFRNSSVLVHLEKKFLRYASFESIVATMAHELSHAILFSTGNELQKSEEATDITAMVLGYRDFFKQKSWYVEPVTTVKYSPEGGILTRMCKKMLNALDHFLKLRICNPGYLKKKEIRFVAKIIDEIVKNKNRD